MSDVLYSEPCRTDPDCEIRIKKAAWNEKYGTDDISAKFTWFDGNGNATRGGEVPLSALPQMLEAAVKSGYLKLGEA
jgi:hypothetical protein